MELAHSKLHLARGHMTIRWLWQWLREVSGDAAYEKYVRSFRRRDAGHRCSGEARPLSREEFYLDSLRRRYNGVSRCC